MSYNEVPSALLALLANVNDPNGLLELNSSGKVPSPQLPSAATGGVTNGVNAAPGIVGEVIRTDLGPSGAIFAPNGNVTFNITSTTLSPGDWDCEGNAVFQPGSSTSIFGTFTASLSTVSGTFPTALETCGFSSFAAANGSVGEPFNLIVGRWQFNVSVPTPLYLVGFVQYNNNGSGGPVVCEAYGSISCRRMR